MPPSRRPLCDFNHVPRPEENGTEGPNAAEAWLIDIDVLYTTLGCTDEQKVQYLALQLTGEAGRWWNARKVLLGNETVITWEMFKVEYNRRFFPRSQRQLQAIEFQNLVQGNMTVEQYSARFMELARFAANLIPDEESKAERFENGLNPRIRERVICLEIKDYARLVEVASLAERGIQESAAVYDLKKRSKQQMTRPVKRLATGSGSRSNMGKNFPPIAKNQRTFCSKCSRTHEGDCRQGTSSCFKFGKPGHFLKDCPMNVAGGMKTQGSGTQARIYSLTPGGVEEEEDEGEEENANVVTGNRVLLANLAMFQMLGFDIILGMDWLSKYYANINCRKKEVIFRSPREEEFKFCGSRVQATPPFLSPIQVRQSIRSGAPAFLAYIKAEPEKERKLEDIPVVCEYPDVFAEVTTGLPPDREIEFAIDLMPRTQPIHKAPYRMAPSELKELKKQLEDLLDRGFIRPSVSPWGAPVLFVRKKDGSLRLCIDYRELN
ncbi:uncharacterized protein LOC133876106 [Alnus glutinosa]|uniref:uncharacterized protein LOC133876106 n=1 Tax=Alnus glutinosa TaxID=3517 RepID=UPI002D77E9AF|nr:uncharacterized protein LOC133876106 [Alnus glutinosa]